jgi:mRNA interferase MazF
VTVDAPRPGDVFFADVDPGRRPWKRDTRPVLIIASADYLEATPGLAVVLPITAVDRGWPHHVAVEGEHGLEVAAWIMTDQPRTLARSRLVERTGDVAPACLAAARAWVADFLDLGGRAR